jgi:hypothetical protein
MINSDGMYENLHVTRMGKKRNAYNVLVENQTERETGKTKARVSGQY